VEHLSNTPRQIFIARSLGYEPPQYAHLPFVAEPGSSHKLSKRKLDKYLKHKDFKALYEHGRGVAEGIGLSVSAETFNPVIVDFYREVGYLPEALVNYLLLLGWSLDDKTEDFRREEMVRHFSLERVNKSPASFDPQKLWAFQQRRMQQLPLEEKTALALPYLQKAGLAVPPPADSPPLVARVLEAAGDRIKTAGDVLDYSEFFLPDERLTYDEKAFDQHVRPAAAADRLRRFRTCLAACELCDAASLEALMRDFVKQEAIKMKDIIHAVRVAVTGKSIGLGMFDTLAILGRERSLARIDKALERIG
jgi:glutamyl-tRNA synthetase